MSDLLTSVRRGARGFAFALSCAIALTTVGVPATGVDQAEAKTFSNPKERKRNAWEVWKHVECSSQRYCYTDVFTVPNNKRLELNSLACSITTRVSTELMSFSLGKSGGDGLSSRQNFPFIGAGPSSEGDTWYTINGDFFMIVEAGQTVNFQTDSMEATGNLNWMACRITGELVTLKK